MTALHQSSGPRYWAVVPAAGVGRRMAAGRPKQYLDLLGCTMIERTLGSLAQCALISAIYVAVAEDDSYWTRLNIPAAWHVCHVPGGEERAISVLNALDALHDGPAEDDDWVLVHDAARPCLRSEDVAQLIRVLDNHPVGGILAVPVADTVKRATPDGVILETVDRHGLWRAQTPQMFRLGALRQALRQGLSAGHTITDEASAMEATGQFPLMVAGHAENIKITSPHDLSMAAAYLSRQAD